MTGARIIRTRTTYCRWRHEVEPEIPLRLITEVRRSAMPGSMGNTGCSRSRAWI